MPTRPGQRSRSAWALAVAAAGVAAATVLWLVRRGPWVGLAGTGPGSARAARASIRSAQELRDCDIRVVAVAAGIVELRGFVLREDQADRAVELAQQPAAVHTVLNRLEVLDEESRLAVTRRRFAAGAADLHETHWYGMRAGMGRRKKRNDGKRSMVDDEMEASDPEEP